MNKQGFIQKNSMLIHTLELIKTESAFLDYQPPKLHRDPLSRQENALKPTEVGRKGGKNYCKHLKSKRKDCVKTLSRKKDYIPNRSQCTSLKCRYEHRRAQIRKKPAKFQAKKGDSECESLIRLRKLTNYFSFAPTFDSKENQGTNS